MLRVPAPVLAKAEVLGLSPWVEGLPELIESLEADWDLRAGEPYTDSSEAYVARAELADGTPAVLKLLLPRDDDAARNEATTLRIAGGEGCARLLREDLARHALLLERLGPSLHDLGLPFTQRQQILCDTAQRVWRPAPDAGLPSGAVKARWLIEFIHETWEALDRPCAEEAVAHAVACAERREAAHDDERAVLVHGDVHEWNTMQAGDDWKLVDPDGLLAEPEYDLGVMLREDPLELMEGDAMARAHWLADRSGLDPVAIWDWGAVERVSTGLLLTRIGMQPIGRQMLEAAEWAARQI